MKKIVMLALLAEFLLTAEASPPRETGIVIPSAQSIQILSSCIEEKLGQYTESDIPGGGVSIKVGEHQELFIHYQPFLYFDLTEVGGNRLITVRYRHPFSKGLAAKNLRQVGRKCFPYELDAAGGGKLP